MEKPSISFFLMNFILLFVGISFILIVFDLQGFPFIFELGILLIFLFLLTFGMFSVYNNKKFGWAMVGATLILLLVNTFLILLFRGRFEITHLTPIFFSVLGILVTILNLPEKTKSEETKLEEYDKIEHYYPYIDKIEPQEQSIETKDLKEELKEEIKKELEEEAIEKKEITIKPKKTIAMSKFAASKETKIYHLSKCGWARIMKSRNKIYFNSKRRAEAEGFKAHECVV